MTIIEVETETGTLMTTRRLVLLCLLLSVPLCVAATAGSQDTPPRTNFSGRWRMDKDKSNFAKFKMPDIVVRIIEQHDPTMNVHLVQTSGEKTTTVDVTYMTDGSPSSNVVNGRDATSRSFWDGKALVVRTDMKTAKNEDEQIEDRYELSDDGQTLTTTSHVVTEKGETTMTMVSTKQKSNS